MNIPVVFIDYYLHHVHAAPHRKNIESHPSAVHATLVTASDDGQLVIPCAGLGDAARDCDHERTIRGMALAMASPIISRCRPRPTYRIKDDVICARKTTSGA